MGRKSNEMHIQKPSIFNEIYMYIDVLILRSNSSFRQIVIQPNYLSCQKLVLREQYPGIAAGYQL